MHPSHPNSPVLSFRSSRRPESFPNGRTGIDELTELLLAAQDGDRFALSAWIKRSQGEVWRLCAQLVSRELADDVTQEVYLRAYRALPAFRGDSSARTCSGSRTTRRGDCRRSRSSSSIRS